MCVCPISGVWSCVVLQTALVLHQLAIRNWVPFAIYLDEIPRTTLKSLTLVGTLSYGFVSMYGVRRSRASYKVQCIQRGTYDAAVEKAPHILSFLSWIAARELVVTGGSVGVQRTH